MDEFEDEDETDDEEDGISTSSAADLPSVSVAVPLAQITPITSPELKRQRIEASTTQSTMMIAPVAVHEQKKLQQPLDEARKLFQRLWTDEDEIELLQGFYEYTTHRGNNNINHHHHHHTDTSLFYDQIKSKLQLEFNKNQLVEKLRRLKKKYRNVVAKIDSGKEFVFKIPHDHATFIISRKIWGELGSGTVGATGTVGLEGGFDEEDANAYSNHKTSKSSVNNISSVNNHCNNEMIDLNNTEKKVNQSKKRQISQLKVEEKTSVDDKSVVTPVSSSILGMIEEMVKGCLSPWLKELMSNAANGGTKGLLSPIPLNFGGSSSVDSLGGEMVNEKWRKQQILELEVYSKRLDLVQDQIKATLEELRSAGSS